MSTSGKVAVAFGFMVASTIVGALVFQQLWSWFVVTAFDLPSLSLALAVGLLTTGRFVAYTYSPPRKEQDVLGDEFESAMVTAFSQAVALYGMAYVVGLVAHWCM